MNKPDATARVARFTRVERIAHWVNAALFTITMSTGAMFYFGLGQSLISDRAIVRGVHVYSGLGILVAFSVAMFPRWGRSLRRDASRINRWSPDDVRWLKTFGRDPTVRLGKFNPGQKLNAVFVAAAALVLAGHRIDHVLEPVVLDRYPYRCRLRPSMVRVVDLDHRVRPHRVGVPRLRVAAGMTLGTVSTAWAKHHRPRWYAEEHTATTPDPVTVDA